MTSPFARFHHRVFLCHGLVRDRFLPPQGVPVHFDEFLYQHLRGLGYSTILYYSHRGLYFFDHASRERVITGDGAKQPTALAAGQPARVSPLAQGPGGLSLRRCAPVPAGPIQTEPGAPMCYPLLNRLTEILVTLQRLTAPGSADAAVIFDTDHISDLGTNGPTTAQFRGFLERDLRSLPPSSRTILIFLFGMELAQLAEQVRRKPALDLLLSVDDRLVPQGIATRIHIGAPERDEVARLIHYYRLVHGLRVDWKTLEQAVLQLTAAFKTDTSQGQRLGGSLKVLEHWLDQLAEGGQTLDTTAVRAITGRHLAEHSALERLDAMIGLAEIKSHVRRTLKSWEHLRPSPRRGHSGVELLRLLQPQTQAGSGDFLHLVLSGNPGTGKTTVAQLLGEIYQEAGLLETGHTVKVGRDGLVGGYVGQTAMKTRERIEQALGGVLFIDEAYSLAQGGETDFGVEAITTLIDAMDTYKDRLCVIFAGYPRDMEKLIASNDGFSRRIKHIVLEDYAPTQLADIFARRCHAAAPPLTCDTDLSDLLPRFFQELFDQRERGFGNAGTVETLFQDMRNALIEELATPAAAHILSRRHIPECYQGYLAQIAASAQGGPLAELEALIGLSEVKHRLRELVETIGLEQTRERQGLRREPIQSGHYLFVGNPGTGKTTVARLMARQFKRMGLLKTARLTETTASQLAGQSYLGQTEQAVRTQVEQALGGVLFIDEAHQLAQPHGFGPNALNTLTALLTNHAGNLTVILAGYADRMPAIFDVDPGLKRRFRIIAFADFTAQELVAAFDRFVQQAGYTRSPDAEPSLLRLFSWMVENKTPAFGNAGAAQQVFEQARCNLARRVTNHPATDPAIINTLLLCDLPEPVHCGDLL